MLGASSDAVLIALISTIGTVLLAVLGIVASVVNKKLDRAEVARVEQGEKIRKLTKATKSNIELVATDRLDQTVAHIESKRELLTATISQMAFMQELIDLKKKAGEEPSPEALAALEAMKKSVTTLQASIDEKEKQHVQQIATKEQDIFNGVLGAVEGKQP